MEFGLFYEAVVSGIAAMMLLLVGCSTSPQQEGVSRGQICSDNCMCCHTEIEMQIKLI